MFRASLIIALVSFPCLAQARVVSTDLTCASATAMVRSSGAVIFETDDNGDYDRFVVDGSHCYTGEVAVTAWIPTEDQSQCQVGFVCRNKKSGPFQN